MFFYRLFCIWLPLQVSLLYAIISVGSSANENSGLRFVLPWPLMLNLTMNSPNRVIEAVFIILIDFILRI